MKPVLVLALYFTMQKKMQKLYRINWFPRTESLIKLIFSRYYNFDSTNQLDAGSIK